MRNRYYTIVTLLILGHILTELHTFILWIDPSSEKFYVGNWFIKPNFTVDNLNVLWYSKMVEDSLVLMAILFAAACQSYSRNYNTYLEWQRYSLRLYTIWCIYFLYHVFDTISFLYNYKTSYVAYIVALTITSTSAAFVGFYKVKNN